MSYFSYLRHFRASSVTRGYFLKLIMSPIQFAWLLNKSTLIYHSYYSLEIKKSHRQQKLNCEFNAHNRYIKYSEATLRAQSFILEYLQLLVSLATAIIPIGWWGISALRTLVSPPVNLLVRSTARRVQSDQKMQFPWIASPKNVPGPDLTIT